MVYCKIWTGPCDISVLTFIIINIMILKNNQAQHFLNNVTLTVLKYILSRSRSAYQKINFLLSQLKHVLKRMGKQIFTILHSKILFI